MTALAEKSTEITNFVAVPRKLTAPYIAGQRAVSKAAVVSKAGGDGDGSVLGFFMIPSSARLDKLELYNVAIAGLTAVNIGLYTVNADGSVTAVSAALFASALDPHLGNTTALDLTHSVTTIANAEKRIWELLSLSADPFVEYAVCATLTTAGANAGALKLAARYAV